MNDLPCSSLEIQTAMEHALKLIDEMKKLKVYLNKLETENAELNQHISNLVSQNDRIEQKRYKLKLQRNSLRLKLEYNQSLGNSTSSTSQTVSSSTEPEMNCESPNRARSSSSWMNIGDLRSQLNQCQQELSELKEEKQRDQMLFNELKKHNAMITNQLENVRATMDSLRNKCTILETYIEEKEQRNGILESKISQLRDERDKLHRIREEEEITRQEVALQRERIARLSLENSHLIQSHLEMDRMLQDTRHELYQLKESTMNNTNSSGADPSRPSSPVRSSSDQSVQTKSTDTSTEVNKSTVHSNSHKGISGSVSIRVKYQFLSYFSLVSTCSFSLLSFARTLQ